MRESSFSANRIFEYADEKFDSFDADVFFVDVEEFAHVLIMCSIKKIWIFLLLFSHLYCLLSSSSSSSSTP